MNTIRIGIDLGTTNSTVGVLKDSSVQIVKNSQGEEVTPSVVFVDKNGEMLVGAKAKRKSIEEIRLSELRNWRAEIKRLMGTNEIISFPNSKRIYSPEEISAKIIDSLRNDVIRRFPDIPTCSAVITVPAHFSTVQSEATKRAAEIAGFTQVVLLQEPIAAAVAYGFDRNRNENWLVYDLGGGTFDVALVACRDDHLTVLAHNGDNFLGGKDLDTAMVEQLFIPELSSQKVDTTDPQLSNRLRILAEQAKIDLTTAESTVVDCDFNDNSGNAIKHYFTITRTSLYNVCASLFQKTIELCRQTILQARVDDNTVKRIVLVGGPTQMPILREYIKQELKIELDGSLDPLTVVACGATLFASQIPLIDPDKTSNTNDKISKKTHGLVLNYLPSSSDDVQTITGKIENNSELEEPFYISFQAENGDFSTGNVILKNGKFAVQLETKDTINKFWIYMLEKNLNVIACKPDSLTISKGLSIAGSPIPHSIGVSILSLAAASGFSDFEEKVDLFFKKNSLLPLKDTKLYHTVRDVNVGESDNALPIRVYEGESNIPDRNTLICDLAINGKMIPKNLKKGSPVELTISVNNSRELSVVAYLPQIDISLNARTTIYAEKSEVCKLKSTLEEQLQRLKHVENSSTEDVNEIKELITDIDKTISRSTGDVEQKIKAAKQVKDLVIAVDKAESISLFEMNKNLFQELANQVQLYIKESKPESKRGERESVFTAIISDGKGAIASKDPISLTQAISKLKEFHFYCLVNDPAFLISLLHDLLASGAPKEAESRFNELVVECETAIKSDSIDNLRNSVLSLYQLTGETSGDAVKQLRSGITQ